MQERECDFSWKERFLRQAQHHGRILADGIQHHWSSEFRSGFSKDVNAFGLKPPEMIQPGAWRKVRLFQDFRPMIGAE